jgi:hypothetical protein
MKQYLLVSSNRFSNCCGNDTELEFYGNKKEIFKFTKEFISKGTVISKDSYHIYELNPNQVFARNKIIWAFYQEPQFNLKNRLYYFNNFIFEENYI